MVRWRRLFQAVVCGLIAVFSADLAWEVAYKWD